MNNQHPFIPYNLPNFSAEELLKKSKEYLEFFEGRRTVREFSDKDVPKKVIENIIKTASTSPSGAHKQPWTFCVVSSKEIKKKIREAAEKEEYESYNNRMPDTWLKDLEPFQTDWHKPFLETVPWIIVVFKKAYDITDGKKTNNYYVNESVGLACGFLLNAIYHCGLAALTHTPSPMNFLTKVLNRPENERPFLLIPVGYLAEGAKVPELKRKSLEEVSVFYE
ncbi:MAG: nitroreductase family protein [Bacteroidia bacterium]|nr:nitroreductase family protein [Bacteroidia bacterium]NNC84765.1 nitroreductase family protein [Bacteroidia bacterium]NNM15891.1 nitroreductase family protein [Bacteroidia bacterium]